MFKRFSLTVAAATTALLVSVSGGAALAAPTEPTPSPSPSIPVADPQPAEPTAPADTATPTPSATPRATEAPATTAPPRADPYSPEAVAARNLRELADELRVIRLGKRVQDVTCGTTLCTLRHEVATLVWNTPTKVATIIPADARVTGSLPFVDVPDGTQFRTEMEWLSAAKVANGWADGTFRPVTNVERGAVAAFLYRIAGSPAFTPPATATFADVPTGHPFHRAVEWMASRRITTGWEDNYVGARYFQPDAPINRDAMAAFLYRFSGSPAFDAPSSSPFRDMNSGTQFYKEVTWLASQKLATGWADGTFRPVTSIKRDATSAMLFRWKGASASYQLPPDQGPLPPVQVVYRMLQPTGTNGGNISPFGPRFHPIHREWRMHNGIDIGNRRGAPIRAAADGRVTLRGWTNGGGNSIYIQHDQFGNVSSRYLHMESFAVSNGQWVARGQVIGYVGSTGLATGPHLHFSVKIGSEFVDPELWIGPRHTFFH